MGWLIAFFLACIAGLLALFLYLQFDERRRLAAELEAAKTRLTALHPFEAENPKLRQERDAMAKNYLAMRARVADVSNAEAEKARVIAEAQAIRDKFNGQLADAKAKYSVSQEQMNKELDELRAQVELLQAEHRQLEQQASLRETGFYESRYSMSTSEAYKHALDLNIARQKEMLQEKEAAKCSKEWIVDGSREAGRKQTEKTLSLMLRAFNGECDAAIGRVKFNNFHVQESRIQRSFEAINKAGAPQACELSPKYLDLKLRELTLTYEHALKVQAEREEQREIKEQMREEAKAAREAERSIQEAEAEERRRQTALERAREDLARASREQQSAERLAELEAKAQELEKQLAEAHANSERAISQAQLTKAGHVYVISNLGSFGDNVYKIGMTRRLDPMDRIWELSDASVPFDFDVHAIIYTGDAPGLENELHQRFGDRRLNVINQRKEFFYVTMEEVAAVVRERCGDIELTLVAEAAEFFQSEGHRRAKGLPLLAERQMLASLQEAP